jgi:hypothetical protein
MELQKEQLKTLSANSSQGLDKAFDEWENKNTRSGNGHFR